jgi:hypothetical protein
MAMNKTTCLAIGLLLVAMATMVGCGMSGRLKRSEKQSMILTYKNYGGAVSFRLCGNGEAVIDWGEGPVETVTLSEVPFDSDTLDIWEINVRQFTRIESTRHQYRGVDTREVVISGNVTGIMTGGNISLTAIETRWMPSLQYLLCEDEKLTSVDVTRNRALKVLNLRSNDLPDIDLQKNRMLTHIDAGYNRLGTLNVSKNLSLIELSCVVNNLADLDVSNNKMLKIMSVGNNRLTSLDLSQNAALKSVICNNNLLTSIRLGEKPALTFLNCSYNELGRESLVDIFHALPQKTRRDRNHHLSFYKNPGSSQVRAEIEDILRGKNWQ